MEASDEELSSVLTRERRYLIPIFQRDYEWTKEGQWELLTDDVFGVADALTAQRDDALRAGEDYNDFDGKVGPHFLGAIVLEGLPIKGADVATAGVIDGQQRLTTIFLLLRGLLDVLTENEMLSRAKPVRRMILIREDEVEVPEEVYKLWPRRRDRKPWISAMSDSPLEDDHPYASARSYFADRIRGRIEGLEPAEARTQLETLVDTLSTKIKIVVVDLDSSDDPQLIFEVLNGRQTALSASDLVKNLLFMRAEGKQASIDDLYEQYWSAFDDKWWAGEVGRGHAARGRRDQLLATWLTIRTSDEVNLGHLYGEARSFLSATSEPLEATLMDIHNLGREYREIYERSANVPEEIAAVYQRLELLGITTAVPLLAWLRTLPESELPTAEHKQCVMSLDSYVMRRLITGGQTRTYGRAFLEVLQSAKSRPEGEPISVAVTNALGRGPLGLTWPTDEEVAAEFQTRTFYNRMNQQRIRMILGPIDALLQSERTKGELAQFNYDNLQIEHVMPQHWSTNWPVLGEDSSATVVAEQERERRINRIGNLTLVTGTLNPSMGHAPWEEKRVELEKHSKLMLNADVVTATTWDESAIDARAEALAKIACRVWPRPDIASEDPSGLVTWTGSAEDRSPSEQLWGMLSPQARLLFAELARHPGERISASELAERLGIPNGINGVAGVLAWPGRYVADLGYHLPSRWQASGSTGQGGAYWMEPGVAELFASVAGESTT